MKTILAILSLASISSPVFAADCGQAALEIAKANMDLKAKAYGFESSSILESSLKKIKESKATGAVSYSVNGSIYKADYTIQVNLDSSCGLESLKIKE